MSEKDIREKTNATEETFSEDDSVPIEQPVVLHRCKCPDCGEDTLELYDFGSWYRCGLIGINSKGEFGCEFVEYQGEYQYAIECPECNFRLPEEFCSDSQRVIEWARSQGDDRKTVQFTCPICGTHELYEAKTESEIRYDVTSIYLTSDGGIRAAINGSEEVLPGSRLRYRCGMDHELMKEDGSPVETEQELIEWLKARQTTTKE
jgi:hypothetical protein